MKKVKLTLSYVVVAIIFTIIGYIVGTHMAIENDPLLENDIEKTESNITSEVDDNTAVGVYHTTSWNGHEASLIINEDGTCEYPGATEPNATWVQDDEFVIITLDNNPDKTHEARLVNNGLLLHDALFVKLT